MAPTLPSAARRNNISRYRQLLTCWCYQPSTEGLNIGLNITSTRWIDLSGGILNEHVSRAANCSRRFGDDFMCHLCAGQDYHP
jgi:hypothetical protein